MARLVAFFAVVAVANNVLAISSNQKTVIQAQLITRGLSCIKDNPLSLEDINTLKMLRMPASGGARCFAACLFRSIGIIDDSGAVSAISARQSAKEVFANDETILSKVEGLVKECEKVNAENVQDEDKDCDRAALAFTCLNENGQKYGFNLMF